MFDLKLFKENKKIFNIIYSRNFLISEYFDIYDYSKILLGNTSDLIIKKITKKMDTAENNYYLKSKNNYFQFVELPPINEISIIKNYLINNYINKIENQYKLPKYCLNINKMYYIDLNNNILEEEQINYNDNIISLKQISGEFILVINLGDEISGFIDFEIIPDLNKKLETGDGMILCKKHVFNLNEVKSGKILLCFINIYDGYNLFEYNRHPNEFVE